jgi:hypothetical protein
MANQPILPTALLAQLDQARAIILPAHREKPRKGSIIPDIAAAYIYINDWAFLNSHGYVNISGSKRREAQYRYACLFYSRKQGKNTRDYRQISEKDRQRVNPLSPGHSNSTSASQPTRERKITTKQASQNRRNIKIQQKKNAKLAKKPKTVNTSQFDVKLPFRSF